MNSYTYDHVYLIERLSQAGIHWLKTSRVDDGTGESLSGDNCSYQRENRDDEINKRTEIMMNHKQKLGYMAIGAGIMAVGIAIGQFITPEIEAQNNGFLMRFSVPN